MIICVASGKGGTGKTTVAVNLALSLGNVQFLDLDVEEPNAYIFLKPRITYAKSASVLIPEVNEKKCTYCGKCASFCNYNAIAVVKRKVLFFPELCHNCGGCGIVCPEKAIKDVPRQKGVVKKGVAGSIHFIYGELGVGEAVSPPLIREVKKTANTNQTTIIDVPPGTSCPVVEATKDSDFCILVTEPTPFGLNDLTLAVEVVRKLKIPFGVVINKADVGDKKVDEYCRKEKISVLMRIPMDEEIAKAYSRGIPVIQAKPEYKDKFVTLYKKVKQLI